MIRIQHSMHALPFAKTNCLAPALPECFGDAVVMRLINDEPRKHMQHAAALTNSDMYKLSASRFKDVIANGRSPTVCALAKRVAVRKTFKRMVPIIKNRLRCVLGYLEQSFCRTSHLDPILALTFHPRSPGT